MGKSSSLAPALELWLGTSASLALSWSATKRGPALRMDSGQALIQSVNVSFCVVIFLQPQNRVYDSSSCTEGPYRAYRTCGEFPFDIPSGSLVPRHSNFGRTAWYSLFAPGIHSI